MATRAEVEQIRKLNEAHRRVGAQRERRRILGQINRWARQSAAAGDVHGETVARQMAQCIRESAKRREQRQKGGR